MILESSPTKKLCWNFNYNSWIVGQYQERKPILFRSSLDSSLQDDKITSQIQSTKTSFDTNSSVTANREVLRINGPLYLVSEDLMVEYMQYL